MNDADSAINLYSHRADEVIMQKNRSADQKNTYFYLLILFWKSEVYTQKRENTRWRS